MKELIKIENKNGNTTVSARELHEFLGIKKHLTQWLIPYTKDNNDYGFIEDVDFTRINAEVNPTNGIPIIDYVLTIEMAKELSMLSKSEKGKEARKYFINCEKQLKNNQLQLMNSDLTRQINEIVQAKIEEIENKCSKYYRPSAFDKTNIAHYIKARLGITKANDEYNLVKERILILLGAEKWEDIPIETLKSSLNLIDESIKIIKSDRPYQQQSMF